ncbi:hypothetical protein [Allosalinactinospora lopnorensis]|nr:hypothetical protein [Allosalinactinospora lopnorensis]
MPPASSAYCARSAKPHNAAHNSTVLGRHEVAAAMDAGRVKAVGA